MVFPRDNNSRSLAKFAALCALNALVLQSSSVNADSCTVTVSPGDAAVGIQIATDSTCASGGIGCINSVCRFCKTSDTPQSSHFTSCSSFTTAPSSTAPAPTTAAPTTTPTTATPVTTTPATTAPATTSTCSISDGDIAQGIQVISDSSCASGGLGCSSNNCRFCKVVNTFQSSHLNTCTSYGVSFPVPNITTQAPTAACAVSDGDYAAGIAAVTDATCSAGGLGCFSDHCRFCQFRTTSQSQHLNQCYSYSSTTAIPSTTVAPVTTTATPVATTATPVATTATPVATTSFPAPPLPSSGSGSSVFGDTLDDGSSSGTTISTCAVSVSAGDAAVGIRVVTDATCLRGGVGCINDVCRFCKVETTTQSAHLTDCSSMSSTTSVPATTTATLVTTTSTPVATDAVTVAPVVTSAPAPTCSRTVSPGDAAVGIQIAADAACAAGGVGCIDSVCRFCKVWSTTQSDHLTDCSSLGYTSAPATTAPVTTAPVTLAPVTTAPVVTSAPTTGSCSQTVNPGDAAVGIQIVADTSCATGGVGCIDSVCRFCQVWYTTQSAHLTSCASIGYTSFTPTTAPVTIAPVTTAPVTAAPDTAAPVTTSPTVTSAPAIGSCGQTVTPGDASVGIQIVTDVSCVAGGVGCIDNVCRFCQVWSTAQSAHFASCASIGYTSFTTAPATLAPVTTAPDTTAPVTLAPVTTAPVTLAPVVTTSPATGTCSQTVTPGDASAGIQIVADTSCSTGGVGCIDNVCRFCQVWSTTQSEHLTTCASLGYSSFTGAPATTAPATTAPDTTAPVTMAPVTVAPDTTAPVTTTAVVTAAVVTSSYCAAQVPSGDVAVGISAVLDASCASGGVGCFGTDNCRYCQVENTTQSANFVTCTVLTTPSVKVMKAAALSNEDKKPFLGSKTTILSIGGGICAAAMVGMMAFVMKRVTRVSTSLLSDASSDDEESEMATLDANTSADDEVA